MIKYEKEGLLLKETVLDLQKGELMCVVRVLAEESRFEIRIPDHRILFDGAGTGRLDVDANGTVLVGKRSERPMRVVSLTDADKNWLIMPGYGFSRKTGKVQPASESILSQLRPKLDQLQKFGKALTPPPGEKELSQRNRRKTEVK